MYSYLLAIELPFSIRQHLVQMLCYGLPSVKWTDEENLHLTLRFLGKMNDATLFAIQDNLTHASFIPFQVMLQGIAYSRSKNGSGTLWISAQPQEAFAKLRKEIDRSLKHLPSLPNETPFQPHVTLGKYEHLSSERLGDYLINHSLYRSPSFEATQSALFRIQHSLKHTSYQLVERYPIA